MAKRRSAQQCESGYGRRSLSLSCQSRPGPARQSEAGKAKRSKASPSEAWLGRAGTASRVPDVSVWERRGWARQAWHNTAGQATAEPSPARQDGFSKAQFGRAECIASLLVEAGTASQRGWDHLPAPSPDRSSLSWMRRRARILMVGLSDSYISCAAAGFNW